MTSHSNGANKCKWCHFNGHCSTYPLLQFLPPFGFSGFTFRRIATVFYSHASQSTLGVLISLLTLSIHIAHDLSSVQVLVCTPLMNASITIYSLKIPMVSLSLDWHPPLVLNRCHMFNELYIEMSQWQLIFINKTEHNVFLPLYLSTTTNPTSLLLFPDSEIEITIL